MSTFIHEVQTIRDLAIAHHAEQGRTLNISFITGHVIPSVIYQQT